MYCSYRQFDNASLGVAGLGTSKQCSSILDYSVARTRVSLRLSPVLNVTQDSALDIVKHTQEYSTDNVTSSM